MSDQGPAEEVANKLLDIGICYQCKHKFPIKELKGSDLSLRVCIVCWEEALDVWAATIK